MPRSSVLVIGGGIGGLSAAIALRAVGCDVRVVELRPDLHSSTTGVGIIQPPNALRALDALGCAEQCLRVGFSAAAWGRMLDVHGDSLGEVPGVTIPDAQLPPMNGLPRPRLHEILTAKAREAGVAIRYGTTVTEVASGSDGVQVLLSDGSRQSADVLVGADGVRSVIRPHVAEDVHPVSNGQLAFRCNIPRAPEIDRIVLQKGPAGIAGFVPLSAGSAYLFYSTPWDRGGRPDEDRLDAVLRERLAPFGGLAGHVRDTCVDDPSQVVVRPEEWLNAPPPWHRGRIVLLGDAVHAVTPQLGQGAAQAIEDGVVLAECLAGHEDVEEAFRRYAERRHERCELVVEASARIGEWDVDPAAEADHHDHAELTQHVLEVMAQPI